MKKIVLLFFCAQLISFTSFSSLSDTIVFDISQATYSSFNNVNFIEIPVQLSAGNNPVNSFDFWFQFDLSKLSYISTTSLLSGLDAFSNFNSTNLYLSNTTSGTSINYLIPSNTNLIILKFIVLGSCTEITSNDFYTSTALINGDVSSSIFINGENNFELTASASSSSICIGASVTLFGSGATTYTWSNGVTNGLAFNPVETTSYSLVGSDSNGCQDTTSISISVFPLPDVTANSSSSIVCLGQSVTLSGSGAASYSWSDSVVDAESFVPTMTTTYFLTGTDLNNCSNTDSIIITIDLCNGISDINDNLFLVYPNPSDDFVTIQIGSNFVNSNYRILNNEGKMMLNGTLNSIETKIDLSGLKPGVYLFCFGEDYYEKIKLLVN
jgi:hypothetical protein